MTNNPPDDLQAAIEAILMVAPDPVTPLELSQATEVPTRQVLEALRSLRADYEGLNGTRQRGFELRETEGEWQLRSRSLYAAWVSQFVLGGSQSTLTKAAAETLAIVAYRQPVTRRQIGKIRGVNADAAVRSLISRDLITESGSNPTGAGLLHTTSKFLEVMGLESLEELVPLAPFMPDVQDAELLEAELP